MIRSVGSDSVPGVCAASPTRPWLARLRTSAALVTAATVVLAASCRTPAGSDQKTLDNMARGADGAFTENQCGQGTPEVAAADGKLLDEIVADSSMVAIEAGVDQASAKAAIRQSLQSIPGVLLGGFFMLDGAIAVTPDAERICASAREQFKDPSQHVFQTEGGRPISSCWRRTIRSVEGSSDHGVDGFVVYVSSDPAKISHGLVRAIGHVLAEHFFKARLDTDANAVDMEGSDSAFAEAKDAIAKALLADTLPGNSSRAELQLYSALLGKVLEANNEASRMTEWANFAKANPDGAELFRTYAFVESFDSFYCSDKTRASMQGSFPKTNAAFKPVADAINAMVGDLPQVGSREELAASAQSAGTTGGTANLTGAAAGSVAAVGLRKAPKASSSDKAGASAALFRGRILGGAARAVGGVARGVGRVGVGVVRGTARVGGAVVRGTGRVVVGTARVAGRVVVGAGRVAVGVVRATGHVVRGAARVAVGVVRGTARVVGVVARGTVRVAAAGVRGAARVTGWVIRGTGEVVRGLFGPFGYLAGCIGLRCARAGLTSTTTDMDSDGVADGSDQCSNTASGTNVHRSGLYAGCAGGQSTDPTIAQMLMDSGYEANGDYDKDGIPNDLDQCSNTPTGVNVHRTGEWSGCGGGQNRDADVLNNLAAVGAGA